MRDPYLKIRPPKSTGREYFGAAYVRKLLAFGRAHKIAPADILYTVTYFTAASISDALRRFVILDHKIHQLIVSGGGANSPLLMVLLKVMLQTQSWPNFIEVLPSSALGVPTDAKESLAFAILAFESFHRRPSNIPSATGARGAAILGKISYALPR
jgi:anhydro-N-acetylmuramic acid kinase